MPATSSPESIAPGDRIGGHGPREPPRCGRCTPVHSPFSLDSRGLDVGEPLRGRVLDRRGDLVHESPDGSRLVVS
jgi:hypothetical protein